MDDLRLSVLDVGLLAVALRCPDGAEFTVATTARKRKPGREALTKSMRNLVACGYIVKLKIQNAQTGTWRTEFSVAGVPFERDDVSHMLAGIKGARAVRVEPNWLDHRGQAGVPDGAEQPRAKGSRHPAAASTNQGPLQVAPTDGPPAAGQPTAGKPTVGEPMVGEPSAKRGRLQVQDISLSSDRVLNDDAGPAARPERETPLPQHPTAGPAAAPGGRGVGAVGEHVAKAWAAARQRRGFTIPVMGAKRVKRTADALAAAGAPRDVLEQAAVDMAREPRWLDLERHLEYWAPPGPARPKAPAPHPYCGACDYGWITDNDGRARKCGCRQAGAHQ